MKISYSNYPILEKIKNGKLGVSNIFTEDMEFLSNSTFVSNLFQDNAAGFAKEIIHISKTFLNAVMGTADKLGGILDEELKTNGVKISATYLIDGVVYCVHSDSNYNNNNYKAKDCMMAFTKSGVPLYAFSQQSENNEGRGWVSENIRSSALKSYFSDNPNDTTEDYLINAIKIIYLINIFRKYANVETVISEAGKKTKSNGTKYVNDTKLNITYLDSKWFTNIVKSEGFAVHGHFRLQPKKVNGEWTKELIYIDEFMKTGYTSKAKILNT